MGLPFHASNVASPLRLRTAKIQPTPFAALVSKTKGLDPMNRVIILLGALLLISCGPPSYAREAATKAAADHNCKSVKVKDYGGTNGAGAWVHLSVCGKVRYYKKVCNETWWTDKDCKWKENQ